MVLFLKKVRLLRYMEMREPLGTKCSGRASQRRVSRNQRFAEDTRHMISRASQRRVSRNQKGRRKNQGRCKSRLAEARE